MLTGFDNNFITVRSDTNSGGGATWNAKKLKSNDYIWHYTSC